MLSEVHLSPRARFGIDLVVNEDIADVLMYSRTQSLMAASEVGNGRIVVLGSTITFDARALEGGRYTTSDYLGAVQVVSELADWLNEKKEVISLQANFADVHSTIMAYNN